MYPGKKKAALRAGTSEGGKNIIDQYIADCSGLIIGEGG